MKTFLYLIYALDACFLPLIYIFLCFLREIRNEFCTRGKGKAANMAKFYIWKVLKSQVAFLREISAILPDDVTGSTSSSSEDATPTKISKRDSKKFQKMAAFVGTAIKEARGEVSSANRASPALEAAEVLVKQKEAEAIELRAKAEAEAIKAASLQKEKEADVLDERTKADKLNARLDQLRKVAESTAISEETRMKAEAALVKDLGI